MQQVQLRNSFRSPLAGRLYPGDDFFSRESHSHLSEAIKVHIDAGKPRLVSALIPTLETFTPAIVAGGGGWGLEKDKVRWEAQTRPLIVAELRRLGDEPF